MKSLLSAAAVVLGLAPAVSAHETRTVYRYVFQTGHVITVGCWRGPWKEVIWDRPEPVFLDDLVRIGYDYPTAQAIANRICRDQNLVGDKEGLKAEMLRIYYDSTVYRRASGKPAYILN
jgi:hypothetical protein